MMDRRMFMGAAGACLALGPSAALARQGAMRAQVFRSPDCGCCGDWIAHLEQNGFLADVVMTDDLEAVKDRHAVPADLRSCHTALIDGYAIEGHVPADDILRLLAERPAAGGIAVPGMPAGSPGMEMGELRDAFDVILWSRGENSVFSQHGG